MPPAYDPIAAMPRLPSPDEIALAQRIAPLIRFSANEPFLPDHAGISVLDAPGQSPSSRLQVAFPDGVAKVIEYAIWWDWDIQHLYELEHIWLKLDANDRVVAVSASAHGKLFDMVRADGSLPMEDGRIVLYSEPGKHAFHAAPGPIIEKKELLSACCAELTSEGHVLVNHMFEHIFTDISPDDHAAVRRHLQAQAFAASFDFTQEFDLGSVIYLSWPELHAYIAGRVPEVLRAVRAEG